MRVQTFNRNTTSRRAIIAMFPRPRGAAAGGPANLGYGYAYGQSYGWDGSPAPDPTVYVFGLLGQSNMVGRNGPIDPVLDATDPDILAMNFTTGLLETAADPLDHFDEAAGDIGPGLSFAKAFLSANPGKKVVLIPAAMGGSGFLRGDWNRKDATYQAALTRLEDGWTQALLEDPYAAFGGFLWAQGEDEVQDYPSTTKAEYEAIVRQFIYYLRADVSAADAATPFLMGGMPPDWVATRGAVGTDIQAVIAETAAIVPKVAYADPTGLASEAGEIIHYSAASYRAMGTRFHTALGVAQASAVAAPTLPARPAGDLVFHFDHTGVPDGNPIFENSGNDLPFRNYGVHLSGGKMVFDGPVMHIAPADFAGLGSSDFRLEVTFETTTTAVKQGLVSQWIQTGNLRSFLLRIDTGGELTFGYSLNGSTGTTALSGGILSANTEYNVVVERVGADLEMFLDGVSVSTFTLPSAATAFFTSAGNTEIGDQNASNPFSGTMSLVSLEIPVP